MNPRIDHLFSENSVSLFLKRDDLIDDLVSGNKLYKLKYNINAARAGAHDTILTFGGAFSNHIAATARYCQQAGLRSIGVIRGERPEPLNDTLAGAQAAGMHTVFVSRETYRHKNEAAYLEHLAMEFNSPFIIPEGGANEHGVRGAREILDDRCSEFDYVCVPMGTGTTFAGLVMAASEHQQVIGFPVSKHTTLLAEIIKIVPDFAAIPASRYLVLNDYHFGGYTKWTPELLEFMRSFFRSTQIQLDPIYTSKMMFGISHLVQKGFFRPGSKLLAIHTGGLQGIPGFEKRFGVSITGG